MTETDTREVDMHEVEFDPETFPEPRPIGPNVMRLGEPGRSRAAYPKGYPRERIARAAMRVARRLGLRRRAGAVRDGAATPDRPRRVVG